MKTVEDQQRDLLKKISTHSAIAGISLAKDCVAASLRTRIWIDHLRTHKPAAAARELLAAAGCSIVEATTYVTLGLGRGAIAAIRTQIDLMLCFSYFSDHPKEWKTLGATGDGFMLRKDVFDYHKVMDKKFGQRLGSIERASKTTLLDIYGILSAHIHGQAKFTLPVATQMDDLVNTKPFLNSVVLLQKQTDFALSNFLLAIYASEWSSLPEAIVKEARVTLPPKEAAEFFS